MSDQTLIRVEKLTKHFPVSQNVLFRRKVEVVQAVDGVSFDIGVGETVGLVGESGCGKTTVGRLLVRLYPLTSGTIYYRDIKLSELHGAELLHARRDIQMVFQDPFASLNPRWNVKSIISEPLTAFKLGTPAEREQRVLELLKLVGLNPHWINRYPHEFSGGQQQRIGIARALASQPEFIVLDEPISSLDVSVQAQVVNLLEELQEKFGLTYLFVAHDLSMVRHISDRIAVMYLGKVVELASRDELYNHPLHPYSQALLSAIPIPDPKKERKRQKIVLKGTVPSPINPPAGCRFHPRCPMAVAQCSSVAPEWREASTGHWVACHVV